MPPRKKASNTTADRGTSEPTRRSGRNRKKAAAVDGPTSEDELSVQLEPTPRKPRKSVDSEVRDEITAYPAHLKQGSQKNSAEDPGEPITDEIAVQTPMSKAGSAQYSETKDEKEPSMRETPTRKQTHEVEGVNGSGDTDELAAEEPAVKKTKVASARHPLPASTPASARKSKSKYDNVDEMLTNPNAPLVKARLRDLLCSSKAWDLLDAEEKAQILDKFPDQQEILDAGTEDARPNIVALRNNNNFRHDVTRYQENIRQGRHDPEWIYSAQAAHSKRELGVYDDYLASRFENDWGTQIPSEDMEPQSGGEQGSEKAEEGTEAVAVNGHAHEDDMHNGDQGPAQQSLEQTQTPTVDAEAMND